MVWVAAKIDVLGGWSVFALNDNCEEFEWVPIGETDVVRLLAQGSMPMDECRDDRE